MPRRAMDLGVMLRFRPALPAVGTGGKGPLLDARSFDAHFESHVIPHAQQQRAVGQLDNLTLVHHAFRLPA